jgi:hypothetical protein
MPTESGEPSTEFGRLLDKLLRLRGVSQYWLGNHSNLGAETICRLRKGRRRPTERHVLRIAVPLLMQPWQIEATNALMEAAEHYIFPLPEKKAKGDGDEQ